MIALVQRPRRRQHLAASHGPEWWTVCDRIVLGAGAAVTPLESALVAGLGDQLCAECERMLVFAGTVGRDRVAQLLASLVRAA